MSSSSTQKPIRVTLSITDRGDPRDDLIDLNDLKTALPFVALRSDKHPIKSFATRILPGLLNRGLIAPYNWERDEQHCRDLLHITIIPMSTKIYNAYVTTAAVHQIYKKAQKLRAECVAEFHGHVGRKIPGITWKRDMDACIDLSIDIASGRRWNNPTAQLLIYPHPRLPQHFLIQTFGVEAPEEQKRFFEALQAEDYHYQNHQDRPGYLSRKEWKQRERDWDRVFKKMRHSPRECGFTFDLITAGEALEIVWTQFAKLYPPQNHSRADYSSEAEGYWNAHNFLEAYPKGPVAIEVFKEALFHDAQHEETK